MSEQMDGASGSTRWRGLRFLLFVLGAALLTAGVWELADNYTAEYDCFHDLQCHDDGGTTASPLDRTTTALGFGLENATAVGDPLPGPRGTVLVLSGVVVLIAAMLMGPGRRAREADERRAQVMSAEQQLERYERLRERGTLSDEEFELRKARLIEPR